jgi:CheY-like chemotaxis protein
MYTQQGELDQQCEASGGLWSAIESRLYNSRSSSGNWVAYHLRRLSLTKMAQNLLNIFAVAFSQIPRRTVFMVLVIDDDRDPNETLAAFLAFKGLCVQCVTNGNEAFLFVDSAHARPALIFLDLVMPVLDEWGFLAERVKYPLFADVPVVILSASSDVAQKSQASRSCGWHEQACRAADSPSRHRAF